MKDGRRKTLFKRNRDERFAFIGGRLCIDFANTCYSPASVEVSFASWSDLVDFLEILRAKNEEELQYLRALAIEDAAGCQEVFLFALELRNSIRIALQKLEAGESVTDGEEIREINSVLESNCGFKRLERVSSGWDLAFIPTKVEPTRALFEIAECAAKLISEDKKGVIRKCQNPACVLYFYDSSPTRRRRWCSMSHCGNRMKVSAFAKRRKNSKQ